MTEQTATVETITPTAGKIPRPTATRKLKNLRPGQIIAPPLWLGNTEPDGTPAEWAIVTGDPLGMQLQKIATGRKRWVWKVTCRFAHEAEARFALEGDGTEDVPVILKPKPLAEYA